MRRSSVCAAGVNAKERDVGQHVSAETLAGWIGAARRKGYAFSRSVFQPGIGIIAMPLPNPLGGRYLAIGVAGSVSYLERNEDAIAAELNATIGGLDVEAEVPVNFTMAKIAVTNRSG